MNARACLDAARANLDAARANLDAARANLDAARGVRSGHLLPPRSCGCDYCLMLISLLMLFTPSIPRAMSIVRLICA